MEAPGLEASKLNGLLALGRPTWSRLRARLSERGAYLCGGDEGAYKRELRELREGLDETGAPAGAPQTA